VNHEWKNAKSAKNSQRTYSTRSLHGQVVHELGKRIVTGDIGEGAVLPNETALGASFDVSRTALREGIKVLTAKGLLASRTRTGTRVRPRNEWNMLDPDILAWSLNSRDPEAFIQDVVEFRRAIEPLAASLAATRANKAEVQDIEQAYADMVAAGEDVQAGVEPDLRFHQGILSASGNELLAPLGALIEAALTASFRLASSSSKLDSFRVHKAVLDAIKDRNPVRAHEAMGELLDYAIVYNTAAVDEMREEKPAG